MILSAIIHNKEIIKFLINKVVSVILTIFQNHIKKNNIICSKKKLLDAEIKTPCMKKRIIFNLIKYLCKESQLRIQNQTLNFL